jgi:hypothetical protein
VKPFLMIGLLAGLVACSTIPDASAFGRRRHACGPCYCAPSRGVTFSSYGCSGGYGTYDDPDTLEGGFLLRLSNLQKYPCTICRSPRGTWCLEYANPKNLPPDNYTLCVVFQKAGTNCSPSFHCPPP